eukprot:TRINITY_DN17544_c0_g1_i1.p1 TRINITY_DN17544_c0_g1~~TRINITY_DN17544_c0_g1_i1.p1  ORF type:complete len:387 (+),score=89.05 TRINITY_DN17544_c0_g1_i1:108-1268(+)
MAFSKVKAEYLTRDCTAEFEVANFPLAVAATTSPYRNKHEFREICSGPIITVGDYLFDIRIVWAVHEDNTVRGDRCLGVYVTRLDRSDGPAVVKLDLRVLNTDPQKVVASLGTSYAPLAFGVGRGCSPSFGSGIGLLDLPVSKVLDTSMGFLHNGALRVECMLSVVIRLEKNNPPLETPIDTKSDLSRDLMELLKSGQQTDVTLCIAGERIPAHSLILAARSRVFAAMLTSCMLEGQGKEKIVEVTQLEPKAVREMVAFLYCGEVSREALESFESALALLQAAHRYEATALIEICAQALGKRLSVENVGECLEVADLYSCQHFKNQCLQFIKGNVADVKGTKGYERLAERRPSLLKDVIEVITEAPSAKRPRTMGGSEQSAVESWM